MADFGSDLRRRLNAGDREDGRLLPCDDDEAREAACVLFETQKILARMKDDPPFAGVVRGHLAKQRRAVLEAEKAAKASSASFGADLSNSLGSSD